MKESIIISKAMVYVGGDRVWNVPKTVVIACGMGLILLGVVVADESPLSQGAGAQIGLCSAKLADLAWLEGEWTSEVSFGRIDIQYAQPAAGLMTSMVRLVPKDGPPFLEFVCFRETADGLELRFRHFNADLVAWEDKDDPIVLQCIESSSDSWIFENPEHDRPKRSTITRISRDEYGYRTEIGTGDGSRVMEGTVRRVGKGNAMADQNKRVLTDEAVVNGTAAQVWAAWTDPKQMSKFFAAESSEIDVRIGGTYELHMIPDAPAGARGCEGCTILSYLPLRMLSFTWTAPPSIPGLRDRGIMTHVVVTMDEFEPGRTRVRIAQMGFGDGEDWDKCYAYFDRAWPRVLEWLGQKIDSIAPSQDVAIPDERLTFDIEVDASAADVWHVFTTKEGVESWMVPSAEVEFKLNGAIRTNYNEQGRLDDPGTIIHRIMSYEPERMFSFQVTQCPAGFPHREATKGTWAVVQLDPIGSNRTRVRLASAGLHFDPGVEEMIKYFAQGNALTLRRLQERFAPSDGSDKHTKVD